MRCLVCRRPMRLLHGEEMSRESMVDDGGTVEVSFGYGSRHDCKMALGFLCDDCFDSNKDLLVNHYDGLAPRLPG